MKRFFIVSLFSMTICTFSYTQIPYNKEQYKQAAIQYYKDFLSQHPGSEYIYREYKPEQILSLSDTARFIYHIPVFALLNPELPETEPNDYSFLLPLVDFTFDSLAQRVILEKGFCNDMLIINKGIAQRMEAYMRKQMAEDDIRDVRFVPFHEDNILLIRNFYFFNENEKFNADLLMEYVQENPKDFLFTIYALGGAWGIRDNQLIYLEFMKDSIRVKDGEHVYQGLLQKYGPMGISNLIAGTSMETIITCIPKLKYKKRKKK